MPLHFRLPKHGTFLVQETTMKQPGLLKWSILLMLAAAFQMGCDAQEKKKETEIKAATTKERGSGKPSFQYDLGKPTVIDLPDEIDEISGIDYNSTEQMIYAIDDGEGYLFKIRLDGGKAKVDEVPFAKPKDYEGIVVVKDTVYVLNSSGSIQFFRDQVPVSGVQQVKSPVKGKNEFEILYKDPKANRLMMVCKDCAGDKKDEVSVWAFNLESKTFSDAPVTAIDVNEIEKATGTRVGRFKPSGAGVHPTTGDVYLISSINKLMVVTDADLKIKMIYKLHRDPFKQPEGLCFTSDGKLLISNEAAGKGKANILIFDPQ